MQTATAPAGEIRNDDVELFGALAARLAANGYDPVPIIPGQKRPEPQRWERGGFAQQADKYRNDYTGILTRDAPGVDIDVSDPELVCQIEAIVLDVTGCHERRPPKRTGNAPRTLLMFRAKEPFSKCETRKYELPGYPGSKPSHVEILASGQQFVAFAVHPDTKLPYRWNGSGNPLTVPHGLLPTLDEAQAREIIRRCEELLSRHTRGMPQDAPERATGAEHATGKVKEGARNKRLSDEAFRLRKQGLNVEQIAGVLLALNKAVCESPLGEDEVRAIAKNKEQVEPETSVEASLLKSEKGAILPCEHNAFLLLGAAPKFEKLHFDTFLSRMRFGDVDWTDDDDRKALLGLQCENNAARFTLGQTRTATRALAYAHKRDSLREFIESLPGWDGTPRIEAAFSDAWGTANTELSRAASRNFFIALIARALHPGAQVDTLWVFEGPQGTFKSMALRALGGSFHAEISAQVGTTDFQRELRGLWIAELSELDSLRGKEASTIKRLLSSPADRFVEKYALHAESYPRRAVAVATTNEATYWQDATGARRLIPVPCGAINCSLIKQNQLPWFAEARHLFENGATWWEFPKSIAGEQESRQQVDPWEDELRGCERIARGDTITSADIMRNLLLLDPHNQGQASGTRLGKVMRRLGFEPVRIGKEQARGWQKPDSLRREQTAGGF